MSKYSLKRWHYFAASLLICNIAGCGTFLSVDETTPENKQPNGVAVNKQVIYKVQVVSTDPAVQLAVPDLSLKGIDEKIMLSINATRMPFASGTLQITVTKEQLVSEVGITSETGAVRAVQAADTAVKTKTDFTKK